MQYWHLVGGEMEGEMRGSAPGGGLPPPSGGSYGAALRNSKILSLEPATLRAALAASSRPLFDKLDGGEGGRVSSSTRCLCGQAWATTRLGEVNREMFTIFGSDKG